MIRMGYELASPMKTMTSLSLLEQVNVRLSNNVELSDKELSDLFGHNFAGFIRCRRYRQYLKSGEEQIKNITVDTQIDDVANSNK